MSVAIAIRELRLIRLVYDLSRASHTPMATTTSKTTTCCVPTRSTALATLSSPSAGNYFDATMLSSFGVLGQAASLVHDVGVDSVRQRHACYRRSGQRAFAQNLRLEFATVTLPGDPLGVFHGVHPNSLVDTILAA